MSQYTVRSAVCTFFLLIAASALATCRAEGSPPAPSRDTTTGANQGGRRFDLYGDPLPEKAVARMGSVRFQNDTFYGPACLSRDGRLFASYGGDGDVRVCERSSGRVLLTISSERTPQEKFRVDIPMQVVGFTVDDRAIVVRTSRGRLQLWNIARTIKVWQNDKYRFDEGSFSADGKRLTGWETPREALVTLDLATGEKVQRYVAPKGKLLAEALSDGEPIVAMVREGQLHVVNLARAKELGSLPADEDSSEWGSHALSPLGSTLASLTVDHKSIRIWSMQTGKVRAFQLPRNMSAYLCFSPDGKTLACVNKELDQGGPWIVLVDVANCAAVGSIENESGEGREGELDGRARLLIGRPAWGFSPDGRRLALQGLCSVRLWDIAQKRPIYRWVVGEAESNPFVAFSGAGHFLGVEQGKTVRFWDLTTGTESPPQCGHSDEIHQLAFSGDGKLLASGGMDGMIRVWETATGKCLQRLSGTPSLNGCVAVSPDGRSLACYDGTFDGLVHVWDLKSGRARLRFKHECALKAGWFGGMPVFASYVAFLSGGNTLAAGLWGCDPVRLIDTFHGTQHSAIHVPTVNRGILAEAFEGLAASPDGAQLAIAVGQERIEIVDPVTTKRRYIIGTPREEHASYPKLFFSSDGRIVGSIRESKARLWEVATGNQISSLLPEGWTSMAVAPTPEGTILAIQQRVGDDAIFLRDVLAAKTICPLSVPPWCTATVISPDGRWVAAVEGDTAIAVWDINELLKNERPSPAALTEQKLARLWDDLLSNDAARAYRAVFALSHSSGQSVPFLDARLQPAKAPDPIKVDGWLRDLDDADFGVRERATRALDSVAELSRRIFEKALADHPSAEKQKRLQNLLQRSERWVPTPDRIRQWRAMMALEQANTMESVKLVTKLAGGVSEHWLTREATASLKRMAARARDR